MKHELDRVIETARTIMRRGGRGIMAFACMRLADDALR